MTCTKKKKNPTLPGAATDPAPRGEGGGPALAGTPAAPLNTPRKKEKAALRHRPQCAFSFVSPGRATVGPAALGGAAVYPPSVGATLVVARFYASKFYILHHFPLFDGLRAPCMAPLLLFLQTVQRRAGRLNHKTGKTYVGPLYRLFHTFNHIIGKTNILRRRSRHRRQLKFPCHTITCYTFVLYNV